MIKKLFSTPKRTAITMGSLFLLLIIIGLGILLTARTAMKHTSIGEENAKNFAFADAGIDPVLAKRVHAEYGHEQGHFVYEVEFVADNTEYEYWIKAEDGSVVKKQMEVLDISGSDIITAEKTEGESQAVSAQGGRGDMPAGESGAATQDSSHTGAQDGQTGASDTQGTGAYIGIDKAKAIALEHVGFTENEVSFSKAKLENDDGYDVYEIEFYKDRMEYEYQINAVTGEIMEYGMDRED